MKRIIFLITAIVLITYSDTYAQSKKELKAEAKRMEMIAATTDKDGYRFFNTKVEHLDFKIRSCSIVGSDLMIEMMIWNNSSRDEHLYLYGSGGDKTRTNAEDNWKKFYSAYGDGRFTFKLGNSTKYITHLSKHFIPAGAPLRVMLKIRGVNTQITKLTSLKLGFESSIAPHTFGRTATIEELYINK